MRKLIFNTYCFKNALVLNVLTLFALLSKAQVTANFSANLVAGCTPLIVSFNNLSTGNPTAWQWDLGNGTLSNQQNPTTTYLLPGIYTVSLKVSNALGSNTITKTQFITVYDLPSASFTTTTSTTGCYPLRENFTDLSLGGTTPISSWFWDFGDGNFSSTQNPLHSYQNSGNYSVTLKVTNTGGCSKVLSKLNYIQVTPGVKSNFSNSTPQLCKPPETINFTNLSTGFGVLSYTWLFGDGSSSILLNPTHNFTTGGNFNITLITQSSLGCVDTLVVPSAIVIKNVQSSFTGINPVCKGILDSFTNTSNPAPLNSTWSFGDGTSSIITNPKKIYNTAGLYSIKLINNYGTCTDSVTKKITVLPLPVANFNAVNTNGCKAPFNVNFTDLSIGGTATAWHWNFGDGSISALQNPVHTYTTNGSFDVTLVVTNNNGCSDSIIKTKFINIKPPIVKIDSLPKNGCVPYTINPIANVVAIDGVAFYHWDFGDGNTSTLQNPSHTYPNQGTYTVKLIVTTNNGCIDSAIILNAVTVGTKPNVNFSASPLTQCAGQPIGFTNLTMPSDTWKWSFGDGGISTDQNPNYPYMDTGMFTIKLVAYNHGCPDSLIKINYVTIKPPVAKFNTYFNCNNKLQVSFVDTSILPQTWFWDFGDGVTSALQNPVHTYTNYGSYNVSLTVSNNTCSSTKYSVINVFNEVANFIILQDSICHIAAATFKTIGINTGNIATYFWNYGDGTSGFDESISKHTYALAGLYKVSLSVTDIRGCISTIFTPNAIKVWGPKSNFSFAPVNACKYATINFIDSSLTDTIHSITKWVWNFDDGVIQSFTKPPFAHQYNTTGTFYPNLTITDSYGCTDTFVTTKHLFITKPKAIFTTPDSLTCSGKNINFVNTSTGYALKYVWDFGDATTSAIINPIKFYTADGNYNVQLIVTDSIGCKDTLYKPNFIKVNAPKANFNTNFPYSSCSPFQVIFSDSSLYAINYKWVFGDSAYSDLIQPTHYYITPATYYPKLIITSNGGCMDSISKPITLYPSTASLNYLPLIGCSPLSVNLKISTLGIVQYLWDFDDGNIQPSKDSTISYSYFLPGNFLPKAILIDTTGCRIPVQGIDTIKTTKTFVNFYANNSLFCDNANVLFTDSSISNKLVTSYKWSFGDGGLSFIQSPSHNYLATGLYTVRLITTTNNGCSDTLTKLNYIKIVPSPKIVIGGNQPVCIHGQLNFSAIITQPDTSKLNWQWNFGNGKTSIAQNPLPQQYDSAGTFVLKLFIINSSGCTDTVNNNILVNPLPIINAGPDATITVGTLLPINPTGSPIIKNSWTPVTDLSCSNCYNTIASPKFTTTYNIMVTDSNGCINSSKITITVKCEDKNIFIPNTFSPNNDGVNDWFYPRGTGLFNIQSMKIFNRWGQLIFYKQNLVPNNPNSGWDGSYNGKIANPDVYVYIIEIVCNNNQIMSYKGNITLIQ